MNSLRAGDVVAGKLRVVRLVGAGGMGAVYEVEHLFTHHTRALKLLHPSIAQASTARERFLREATAAGRIGSPHVVETFDAGILDDGSPFLLMELLEGQSLDELLEAQGALELAFCLELLSQVCEGVQAAHDAGIVHRDLKPENLFVASVRGAPFIKILDFGISKFDIDLDLTSALTREGALLGTPFYMAPEQLLKRRPASIESDIYALGVIAYQCLTGKRPFEAESLPELSVRLNEGSYDTLDVLRGDIPKEVSDAIARAMSREPEDRFHTARELQLALEQGRASPPKIEPSVERPRGRGVYRPMLFVGLLLGLLTALGFALLRTPNDPAESPVATATGDSPVDSVLASAARPSPVLSLSASAERASTQAPDAPPSASFSGRPPSVQPSAAARPAASSPGAAPPTVQGAPRDPSRSEKLQLDTANPY
ncbi:MAG: serine/threonine protein kinase [Polyangiaceae bacterium]|nr:serine/threonine protein kinase [Myxococcales bacterium]MCB9587097.1 serine/threonine protein kinase [Polyangiaceae bacterium]MCB9609528.1 serine/threonine protein kinase [Polyangiaceae bacterium]